MCEDRVTNFTTQVYKDFNSSLQSYRPVAAQGLLVNLPNTTWNELNATVAVNAKAAKNLIDQVLPESDPVFWVRFGLNVKPDPIGALLVVPHFWQF
ncbi:hypothetical protein AXG93_1862s1470 [Marchantia polymorpha subsp. ruderalis]|uniref:Uncharacterized protein n=1 Tax=Marchantia polymorpha subsp. ruderalis TaxID=1480154 RepID=A0A176W860_MARPO|nr:hypothetical protein AXG93_1862s1470 [Marchantia polymorpha subsp. ruderalis]